MERLNDVGFVIEAFAGPRDAALLSAVLGTTDVLIVAPTDVPVDVGVYPDPAGFAAAGDDVVLVLRDVVGVAMATIP